MDIRGVEMRLQWLEVERGHLIKASLDATPDERERMSQKIHEIEIRCAECRDWLEIDKADPKFGEYHKGDNGRWHPKLPTFKNAGDREDVLSNMEGKGESDPAEIKAAREWRARKDAQEQADYLDGKNADRSAA